MRVLHRLGGEEGGASVRLLPSEGRLVAHTGEGIDREVDVLNLRLLET